MKNNYESIQNDLLNLAEEFQTLLSAAQDQAGMVDAAIESKRAACDAICRQLAENTLRIAAVGPIKSGKSSFVNAILGGDYLKRGAGVVTSFVTRVRSGPALRARLVF
jgi:hypothetical protein